MKLPIIQSLWIGKPLSNVEKLCIQSFLDHGHEFHLYTYADIGGIPSGATVKDGNEILPESDIFTYKGGSYAGFSNWFRYKLLYDKGGWWVDMDIVCIRPFDFTDEIIFAGLGRGGCNTAPLRMPKKHPLLLALIGHCKNIKPKQNSPFGSVGGPHTFTKFIRQFEMQDFVKSPTTFFLASYLLFTAFDKTFAGCRLLFPHTYALHISNNSINILGIDKNTRFDSASLFETLKTKHGIKNHPDAKHISCEELHEFTARKSTKRKARIKRERILFLLIAFALGLIAGLVAANL